MNDDGPVTTERNHRHQLFAAFVGAGLFVGGLAELCCSRSAHSTVIILNTVLAFVVLQLEEIGLISSETTTLLVTFHGAVFVSMEVGASVIANPHNSR